MTVTEIIATTATTAEPLDPEQTVRIERATVGLENILAELLG